VRGSSSGGLLATPWHPVRRIGDDSGSWTFPAELVEASKRKCDAVYNLVLDSGHILLLNDVIETVTLGHGLVGPVVGHDFYGTDRVLELLSAAGGWEVGRVFLGGTSSSHYGHCSGNSVTPVLLDPIKVC